MDDKLNKDWSLEALYKDYSDTKYLSDIQRLIQLNEEMEALSKDIFNKDENIALFKTIEYMEEYTLLSNKVGSYISLRQSINTRDLETVNESNKYEKIISNFSKIFSVLVKFIASISDKSKYAKANSKVNGYMFWMKEKEKEAKYLLDEKVEDIIAKLNISAGLAWSNMHGFLTSTVDVDLDEKQVTLSEVRNMAYSHSAETRKKAYEAELAAYEKINESISFSLNNIKTQVNTICDIRGYESPLHQTLNASRMNMETLEAMLAAIKDYLPTFRRYLKHKGKLLGHKNGLPWYDLFAPIGKSEKVFSKEEAKSYLLKHFKEFSSDLYLMTEKAFNNRWIDFEPKKGKVGGAFCVNLPFIKESRILSNFTGTLSDVITLAHELGHAYHGMIIEEHLPLNTEYSMPVAETASTFNETIIMDAAIKDAKGSEKVSLIESQLQDITQIIVDIYSRYLFETNVFNKSREGFLFSEELKELMINAQKEAYGDGLDHNYLHPYMWINKVHYYSDTLSFYNFPYAFGGLLAKGMYEKYIQEGDMFVKKYNKFLYSTTIMSVEEAAKVAEIDLQDQKFWARSLKSYETLVDEFIKETKEGTVL